MKSEKYRFGFDVAGLILFLLVMAPTFIWLADPAPNDMLRAESITPVADIIGLVCQILFIACLCMIINKGRSKLVILVVGLLLLAYSFWWLKQKV